MKLLPGSPYPLGATWDGEGVNFALYSENATGVELCLFDEAGAETRLAVPNRTAYVFHAYAPGLGPGQRYGFRVHGPYEPPRGLRFNPHVVLLDPYAKAVDGVERWDAGCFAYELGRPEADLKPVDRDQLGAPRGVVIDPAFDWEDDEKPQTPMHRTVIYEAHVRGLTMRHPEVPEPLRGTYAGIAHPAVVRYLRDLGITAIELMPVHAFVDDKILLDRGLRNYWGYNTIGFFAPDVRYKSARELGGEVREFKEMVKALHRAGIEVILDVVYNHTAEGNALGPTMSLKGIDNPTYYRLVEGDPRHYFDYTGTGNTLNVRHPQTLQLLMDSLRYWATEMRVDGFRFDLASALARGLYDVDQLSSFFALIHQSPSLRNVKLIAEPWDVGPGGYQVGNFPVRWAEWNGKYRDTIRAFWRGEGGVAAELGYRLTGSSDLYGESGRQPHASVNLVTAHDGFTLSDLVSYDEKHNEANGEQNRDGHDDNKSWNCGVEGPTSDPKVLALRRRQRRNLLATLLLSQGTPMLLAGDERGRTQRGNNNAYCQDNETSWVDWGGDDEARSLYAFTRRLLRIRRAHPALRRSKFFRGRRIHGTDLRDILWFRHDGAPMSEADWSNPGTKSLGMFLSGRGIDDVDEHGRPLVDDNFLLLLNASDADVAFTVPKLEAVREAWQVLVDTGDERAEGRLKPGESTALVARSLKLLRAPSPSLRTGSSVHTLGSTYRLQFGPKFGFKAALGVVDYLHDLGVTDVYTSPLLQAAKGSTHGYDLVDYGKLNEELGGEEGFRAFTDKLREKGMGLLLDWVPNHMGIPAGQNRLWDDLLENGPSSLYAEFFDIDWWPPKHGLKDKVLLPILGDQYGVVLERGELKVAWEGGALCLAYYDKRLPLGPKTWLPLLEAALARAGLPEDGEARLEFESILSALRHMPSQRDTSPEQRRERAREKEVVKRRLGELEARSPAVAAALREAIDEFNGVAGVPASFDALDQMIQSQGYRLASWRVASEEINYRRFFDVNDLAAVRMEDPRVFEHAHALLFKLVDERRVTALRLDHTDGLYDPFAYFESLQRRFEAPPAEGGALATPDDLARPLPLLVEKILGPDERLPSRWPVDGTTGYEFLNHALGLWNDPRSEPALTRFYQRFTGDATPFVDHVYAAKHYILRHSLASEVNMLARALERIAGKNRRWRDFTLISLTSALVEAIAAFPVYRTYLRPGEPPSEQDKARVKHAIAVARRVNQGIAAPVFDFLEDVLLMRAEGGADAEQERFALRFQQLTGPVTAKAVEDTAFYRYHRLVNRNEVGGDPASFAESPEGFHAHNAERLRRWPLGMVTLSTHDTKRGEDTAARIAVLTEVPDEWRHAVSRWSRRAERFKVGSNGGAAPTRSDEYLFYQALVGAWPYGWDGAAGRDEFAARLADYMTKAAKEAKVHTSWTNPNPAYDEALANFVRRVLGDEDFVADVRAFCELIAPAGATNGLAQALLRYCVPGVADTYQGSELWNQSLVDPDNRRPVEYGRRREMLGEIVRRKGEPRALARDLVARYADGAVKLYVTHVALTARRNLRNLFLRGDYEALPGDEHVVAFCRSWGVDRFVCCVPRLPYGVTRGERPFPLGDAWGNRCLTLPHSGRYSNAFTGAIVQNRGEIPLAELFADFPVALLFLEP
ncbi:MAG TPA: glycogen debranching protein GlgX [Polyangiaceae bacterium]|nr:glycogen debranching protein GlgX [Polyangiaceae bacterium]